MTARPARRRRRTIIGAAVAAVLVLTAAGLTAVGANAVINSTAGEAVERETRPVIALPSTDNAALAVVDADNRLTSLLVATLLPSGLGGSLVTIPVNADAGIGVTEARLPLDRDLDPADPERFFQQVEATLAITLQFGEIVGAERLVELLEPVLPVDAEFITDVIDSSAPGDGVVVESGEQELDGSLVAAVLRSTDDEASERAQHANDVAVWSGVAASAPASTVVDVPMDAVGRPATAATIDELFARLWSGPVQARDIQLESPQPPGSDSAVVLDRRDVVLVFSQISPARVSTPNPGPVFRIEIPISSAQFDAAPGDLRSRRAVGLDLVGRLLFFQSNIVSVDATASSDGAPTVTRIEVANQDYVDSMEELGTLLFGEFEVVVATERIDGVDVSVRLGTGYLDARAAQEIAEAGSDVVPDEQTPDASTPDDAATVDTDG